MKTSYKLLTLRDWVALALFLALCLGVSALGGLATSSSVDGWYRLLEKPAFNPPSWVFAPVWTILYIMMAIAGWLVWRQPVSPARRRALAAFFIQLGLNLGWSVLFFGLQQIALAAFEMALLLAAIGATIIWSWRVDRLAAGLLLPYLVWVCFALLLNLSIWALN